MHRFRIIDRGWNALRLERRGETVAIAALWQPYRVLRPDRCAAAGEARNGHDIAETTRIALRDLVARFDLVFEDFQFLDQNRCLHGIEPPGQPETDIVVFVETLAVDADAAQRLGEFGIVGENRSAVAKAAKRFCREKTGRGGKAKAAETAALVAGAKCLCRVIEHEHALCLGDRRDCIMVGGLPEQIDWDNGLRLEPLLFRERDSVLQGSRVDIKRYFIDIDEDRRRSKKC